MLKHNRLDRFFAEEKIEYFGCLPFSECRILGGHRLARRGFSPSSAESALLFLVPYYRRTEGRSNISQYAFSQDYHLYFNDLFSRLEPLFRELYPGCQAAGFADISPIDEVDAAAKAGLGMIGRHGMLINEKYASFVFIGELISDVPHDNIADAKPEYRTQQCENCGRCACRHPACISSISQKKGVLSSAEREIIKNGGYVWGCDDCAMRCPHSENAAETEIDFFLTDCIPFIDAATVAAMSDEEFAKRAYSWRPRETLLRNIDILYQNPQ